MGLQQQWAQWVKSAAVPTRLRQPHWCRVRGIQGQHNKKTTRQGLRDIGKGGERHSTQNSFTSGGKEGRTDGLGKAVERHEESQERQAWAAGRGGGLWL